MMRGVFRGISACLLVLHPCIAPAEIYRWTDDQGVTSYTDNRRNIPPEYRSRAKAVTGQGEGGSVQTVPSSPSAPPPPPETVQPQPGRDTYGGKNGAWWSSRFRSLYNERTTLQKRMEDTGKNMTQYRRNYLLGVRGSIAQNRQKFQDAKSALEEGEKRLQMLETELRELEAEADRAGVPRELREPPENR